MNDSATCLKPDLSESFLHPVRTGASSLRKTAFRDEYHANERIVAASPECFMTTIEKKITKSEHIFFVHGGGNVLEANAHRDVAMSLADLGFRVTLVAYPLAPEHRYQEQQDAVYHSFVQLSREYPNDKFAVLGDSCGTLLSLALVFRLRNEKFNKTPTKFAFVSPHTDVSYSNPELIDSEKKDGILSINAMLICSRAYADEQKWRDPEVSPIYAPQEWYKQMGSFLIYYSDSELLFPDQEIFIRKIKNAGGNQVTAYRVDDQTHDYILHPELPSSKTTIAGIGAFFE